MTEKAKEFKNLRSAVKLLNKRAALYEQLLQKLKIVVPDNLQETIKSELALIKEKTKIKS